MSGNRGLSIEDREPIKFENAWSRCFSRGNKVNCHLAEEMHSSEKVIKVSLSSEYKCSLHLGTQRKMTEIIKLIRYENNERLGSDSFSDENDHRNSNLSINRPTCKIVLN